MLHKIKSLLIKKDTAPSSVRLESAERWLRGQINEEIQVSVNRVVTVFDEMRDSYESLRAATGHLSSSSLRVEDFPDAPKSVSKGKADLAKDLLLALDDIKSAMHKDKNTFDECLNKYHELDTAVQRIEESLRDKGHLVQRYFPLHVQQISPLVKDLRHMLANVQEIFTSPPLGTITEIQIHVSQAVEKINKRKMIREHMTALQEKIDVKYKEFLRFESKIKEIKESKRFKLETSVPKDKRPSSVGHFSVLEHEIKELEQRKALLEEAMQGLRLHMQKYKKALQALPIDGHIERVRQLLMQRTRLPVEVIHDDL